MPTRLVHMVIDANDPPKLARFWAGALDWVVEEEDGAEEVDVSPPGFQYPDPVALPLVFVPVSDGSWWEGRSSHDRPPVVVVAG